MNSYWTIICDRLFHKHWKYNEQNKVPSPLDLTSQVTHKQIHKYSSSVISALKKTTIGGKDQVVMGGSKVSSSGRNDI